MLRILGRCLNFVQRFSIAAGRGFIAGHAPELKPIEKLKYKITTKEQQYSVRRNRC